MSLELFAHPFSSYCQKVLIALWADGTKFDYRLLEQDHPENFAELKRHWPFGQFPVLLEANTNPDKAAAKRAFEAMMTMKKIDIATIEAALKGETINA